jgi:hypothetical protein
LSREEPRHDRKRLEVLAELEGSQTDLTSQCAAGARWPRSCPLLIAGALVLGSAAYVFSRARASSILDPRMN